MGESAYFPLKTNEIRMDNDENIDETNERCHLTTSRLSSLCNSVKDDDVGIDQATNCFFSLCDKLKNDTIYRGKFLKTWAIFGLYFTVGWVIGQIGPSLLDLQLIAGTTLEKSSLFLTSMNVGYLVGAIAMGILFDRFSLYRNCFMFVCVLIHGVATAAVPWCSSFEAMVIIHVLKGILIGGFDTGGNAEMFATWGEEGVAFYQGVHSAYAIGGVLSPLATAPFVARVESYNISLVSENSTQILNTKNNTESVSRIYVAYWITACFCILASIPFCVFFYKDFRGNKIRETKASHPKMETGNKKKLTKFQIFGLANVICFLSIYVAVEDTFVGYLTSFVVKQFKWTKAEGSYVTSGHWAAFAAGRIYGIFVVHWITPSKILFIHTWFMLLSFIGFLVSSVLELSSGIWLFSILTGSTSSVMFATIMSWTEQNIAHMTGTVMSLCLVFASIGNMLNPTLLGFLMESRSSMWFSYLLTGQSVGMFVCFVTALCISKKITRQAINNLDQEITI